MTNLSCTFLLICLRHTVHKYKCCQWGQPLVQAALQALHRFNALAASSAYPIQGHFGGCSLSQLAEGKRQGTPSHQSVVGLKQGTIHTLDNLRSPFLNWHHSMHVFGYWEEAGAHKEPSCLKLTVLTTAPPKLQTRNHAHKSLKT